MELKKYQEDTLALLRTYVQKARISNPQEAYEEVTSSPDVLARLGIYREYREVPGLPKTPRVCLKIPTGGGKTILASHALRIIADSWCNRENPFVLWFTPTEAIRMQTVEALKNTRHPYRVALEEQFQGKVRVYDLDEKFNITSADIEQNLCILVSTMQSFRQHNVANYNVYKHNENLEPHFSRIPKQEGMEYNEDGSLKYSFANMLFYYRPIVVVDEAHRAISELTEEMLTRIHPTFLLELSATPYRNNNTLYCVTARELKEEEMIKLPILMETCKNWEQAIQGAVICQKRLEDLAAKDKSYIRPLVLVQAQSEKINEARITPEVIKAHLMHTHNIPDSQIAIVTANQKELDNVDVFDRNCKTRFVITIEALKEGWDCPFAYILCSVSNIRNNTSIQQILGRVLRMPYAKKREIPALNKAYAFVCSEHFLEAEDGIIECLKESGFEEEMIPSSIQQVPKQELLSGLLVDTGIPVPPDLEHLVGSSPNVLVKTNITGEKTIHILPNAEAADLRRATEKLPSQKKLEVERYIEARRPRDPEPDRVLTRAEQGEVLFVPRLMSQIQGEFVFAETDDIVEAFPWNIRDFAADSISANEISLDVHGERVLIDLNGHSLKRIHVDNQSDEIVQGVLDISTDFEAPKGWTLPALARWLDEKVRQEDIDQAQMIGWISNILHGLHIAQGIPVARLMQAKYALADKLRSLIEAARKKMRKEAYQACLFGDKARVQLNFENGFEFKAGMYDDVLCYSGNQKFNKHFLPNVPMIGNGKSDGQEIECAICIDTLPEVKYWIRNVSRHRNSFYLPTSTDNFYPDFVALLEDGRILLVEFKGENILTTEDSIEKLAIGEFWETLSEGKGVFVMPTIDKTKPSLKEQILAKIRS